MSNFIHYRRTIFIYMFTCSIIAIFITAYLRGFSLDFTIQLLDEIDFRHRLFLWSTRYRVFFISCWPTINTIGCRSTLSFCAVSSLLTQIRCTTAITTYISYARRFFTPFTYHTFHDDNDGALLDSLDNRKHDIFQYIVYLTRSASLTSYLYLFRWRARHS